MLLLGAVPAHALNARVQWSPSPDARVVGYHVWVRPAGTRYGTPIDAGAPARATDGSMSVGVRNLDDGTTYFFAVTGYTADPFTESGLSVERSLGSLSGCSIDRCWSPDRCEFYTAPDGLSCAAANGDPCGSVCRGGTCIPAIPSTLETHVVKFLASSRGVRLTAQGRFTATDVRDPDFAGLVVSLRSPSGTPLYVLNLPGSALRRNGTGRVFSLDRARRVDAPPGIERLLIRRFGDTWALRLKTLIDGAESAPSGDTAPATWNVLVADRCARDLALDCAGDTHFLTCK
ncbi:MAG: fibronectin type III domain-containing protein [Candidatus Binatia bacterium]